MMRPGKAAALRALAAALLLPAAASAADSTPATAAPTAINACALLTSAEIARVIGTAVDGGQRRDAGLEKNGAYSSACIWTLQRDLTKPADPAATFGGKAFVILNAQRWPAGSGKAGSFLEEFRQAAAHGEIPHAPVQRHFGDEALWWGDGLAVRVGDVSFGVSVFNPAARPKDYAGQLEEQLAPLILGRLAAN